jgi:hypothetical protein
MIDVFMFSNFLWALGVVVAILSVTIF